MIDRVFEAARITAAGRGLNAKSFPPHTAQGGGHVAVSRAVCGIHNFNCWKQFAVFIFNKAVCVAINPACGRQFFERARRIERQSQWRLIFRNGIGRNQRGGHGLVESCDIFHNAGFVNRQSEGAAHGGVCERIHAAIGKIWPAIEGEKIRAERVKHMQIISLGIFNLLEHIASVFNKSVGQPINVAILKRQHGGV